MPKSKTQSNLAKRNRSNPPLSTRRHFARLFIHSPFPLVNNNNPQKQNNTPCSAEIEEAYNKIHLESEGRLVLSEGAYHGDEVRHFLFCHECGHHVMASYDEIKVGAVCPHCLGDKFLDRFTSIKQMQNYCLDVSLQAAYYLGRNRIGGKMDETRNFYCMIHRVSYQATMKQFFNDAHGCPACISDCKARERPE
jgi:hypothetical protein